MDRAGRVAQRPAAGGEAGRVAWLRAAFGPGGPEELYVEAPWKIFGPVGPPGALPTYYVTNVTAGILAGDRLAAQVSLRPGARVRVAAPAATRVHSMGSGQTAHQSLTFHLAPGAYLLYWPHQLIPYAGARYTQETYFHLAPGAGLVAAELLAPGRVGAGEAFRFAALHLLTHLYLDGRLAVADQVHLGPEVALGGRLGVLDGHTHVGTLYLAGAAAMVDLDHLVAHLEALPGVLVGVSRPHPQVVVARVLGQGAEPVAAALAAMAPGLV